MPFSLSVYDSTRSDLISSDLISVTIHALFVSFFFPARVFSKEYRRHGCLRARV